MAEQRKSRGFTRVDALAVGVMCLVFVLLVPMLCAMTQEHYFRLVCGTNLSEVGKTMFIYANDYEDALPRAGGRNTAWGPVANWTSANRYQAYALAADGSGGRATISSCLYLLVKYYETPAGFFICPGDKGTTEFKLSNVAACLPSNFELIDAWDFGPQPIPCTSCSFSYHLPFGSSYALTTSRDPNMAVAADRNPWFPSPASDPPPWVAFKPDLPGFGGGPQQARASNAIAHQQDGQNVLFLDGRVTFETRSYCGVESYYGIGKDNIYTVGTLDGGEPYGTMPGLFSVPLSETDSLLVHDPKGFPNYGATKS